MVAEIFLTFLLTLMGIGQLFSIVLRGACMMHGFFFFKFFKVKSGFCPLRLVSYGFFMIDGNFSLTFAVVYANIFFSWLCLF